MSVESKRYMRALPRSFVATAASAALFSMSANATTFNVGGGTIVTSQNAFITDQTGTGGGARVSVDNSSGGNVISITNVVIQNTAGGGLGDHALGLGEHIGIGSLTITMNGSSLTARSGTTGKGLYAQIGGTISLTSTPGTVNTISGYTGYEFISSGGNIAINTGADTITATLTAISATASTGSVIVNSAGGQFSASMTGGNGLELNAATSVTVGSLNGGFAGTVTTPSSYAFRINAPQASITLASSSKVEGKGGINWTGAGELILDSSGTISSDDDPLVRNLFNSKLTVTLRSGSSTKGAVQGGTGSDSLTVYTGATLTGFSFGGGDGTDTVFLKGSGAGTFDTGNNMSGIEVVQKDDAGTWTLTSLGSSNTSTFLINAGTISVANSAAFGQNGSTVALRNSSVLRITANGTFTHAMTIENSPTLDTFGRAIIYSGRVSDGASSGGLTVKGGGSLSLTNTLNSYTGGTVVQENSTLLLASTSALGTGGITLGDATTSGALRAMAGFTLNDKSVALAAGGGRFDTNGFDVTSSAAISGAGSFSKEGTGALILSGTKTYTGATLVNAGRLAVNGSIASSSGVTVASGGTLGGTGTVAKTTIASGGTLAPGNSIGTLAVSGNLTFNSGSIFAVEMTPTSTDLVTVTGSASLAGTVSASPSGTYTAGQKITILTAAGGVTGTFSSLTGNFGSVRAVLGYDANSAFISILPLSLNTQLPAGTPENVQGIASAIDTVILQGSGDIFLPLFSLSPADLQTVLSQMSAELAGGSVESASQFTSSFLQTLLNPYTGTRSGLSGVAQASSVIRLASAGGADLPSPNGFQFWGSLYGSTGDIDGDATLGTQNAYIDSYGLMVGLDYRMPSDDMIIGAAFGFGQSRWDLSGNLGDGRSDSWQFGVYGLKNFGASYLSLAAGYSWFGNKTSRTVIFTGTNLYKADYDAEGASFRAEGGHRFESDRIGITPFIAFQAQQFSNPAYAETVSSGIAGFALSYAKSTHTDVTTELGLQLDRLFATGADDNVIGITARASWVHDYSDRPVTIANFSAFPTSSFTSAGAAAPEDLARMSIGLEAALERNILLAVKPQAELSSKSRSFGGNATLSVRW